jgi:dienelactone hydrolase
LEFYRVLQKNQIEYQSDQVICKGYYVFDDTIKEKKPGILIAHDWTGITSFTMQKAEKLAELGYVGFALDMYGSGATGASKEEKTALMQPLINDRALLLQRMTAAFKTLQSLDMVDIKKTAAMGFCFGGLCALDLARSGAELKGVVSFHGNLSKPSLPVTKPFLSKVLALHGYADPLVPKNQVNDFEQEMIARKVDWQLHVYGNAMHSFTNPSANDVDFGTVYNAMADARSWVAMKDFFAEIF